MSTALPIVRDDRRRDLAAAVSQTVFGFDAPLLAAADLAVFVRMGTGGWAMQSPPAYAVTLLDGNVGAEVAFSAAPRMSAEVPVTVRLDGRRVANRSTDATRGGAIASTALERDFDALTLTLQELRRDLDDASLSAAALSATVAGLLEAVGLSAADVGLPQWRLRRALARLGALWTVQGAISGDPTDPVAIAWSCGQPLVPGGVLWSAIADALDYDAAEMTALLTLALTMEP